MDSWSLMKMVNDPDRLPEDDHSLYTQQIAYLNRIDQEWTCDEVIQFIPGTYNEPEYCGLPEHDPFTNLCRDHTPGNLPSGHM